MSVQPPRPHQVLDPRLLGRPVHLLPAFAARFADALSAVLASPAGRRYWGGFIVGAASFVRAPEGVSLRWLGVAGAQGMVAVAFERALLLALLDARYGGKGTPATLREPKDERVSATEERLATVLTRQLADVLASRVAAAPHGVGVDGTPPQAVPAPDSSAWVLELALRPAGSAATSRCWLAPDPALMGAILQGLAPQQGARAPRMRAEPLSSSLKVKLDGQLLSKDMTLEALFALRVGDIIPVNVGRADVLLDEARLFTAAVAEHKGKLCLTQFEDAE